MKRLTVILFASLMTLASGYAAAETPAGQAKQKGGGACAQDIQTLCAGIQKGGGRINKCLNEHAAQVSPACQAERKERKAENKAIKAACQADIKQFCASTKGGEMFKCLESHEAQLSPGCAQARD